MVTATVNPAARITTGHIFGVKTYKRKKFGVGHLAWLAFEDWAPEVIGRRCAVEDLRDGEARLLIERMRCLPDVPPEGQETLF